MYRTPLRYYTYYTYQSFSKASHIFLHKYYDIFVSVIPQAHCILVHFIKRSILMATLAVSVSFGDVLYQVQGLDYLFIFCVEI